MAFYFVILSKTPNFASAFDFIGLDLKVLKVTASEYKN